MTGERERSRREGADLEARDGEDVGPPREHGLARHEEEERRAERVDVGELPVDGPSGYDLGCREGGGAGGGERPVEGAREPEVPEPELAVAPEEEVRGLHVA